MDDDCCRMIGNILKKISLCAGMMHKLCVLGVDQLLNVYDGLIVCTGMN